MAKPKYPWPISIVMSPYVFDDGSEVWPSGREQFSYLSPEKRRMNIVVANPATDKGREFVVISQSIRRFTDGADASPQERQRVRQVLEEYFQSRKWRVRFVEQ
jgi:hypothetical protein